MVIRFLLGRRRARRRQRECFHHSLLDGESWVRGQLVDIGRRKIYWCTGCDRHWG